MNALETEQLKSDFNYFVSFSIMSAKSSHISQDEHVLVSQVIGPVIIEARTPNDLLKDVKMEYQEFSQQGVIRVTWSHKPGSNSTLYSQRLTICKSV